MLLAIVNEAPRAVTHANELNSKSMDLEALLTNTRNLTGVRAASVYQDISNNIATARELANEALKSADNATNLVQYHYIRD